ncbi:MAG: glyoxalase [Alphaproteobacteria bacterium PA4]|nr:MAG: glyoxalase [Alphaproteobacteria bacterium PA4]
MPAALKGIHHSAYRCRDAEETRAFYEDVLGLPLAGLVIEEREPGSGRKNPFVHIFFALGDGNFLAFFDAPGSATPEAFQPVHGFDRHVAFEAADAAALADWQAKLNAAGIPCFGPIDHGFVRSIYFQDPNGLPLEITLRVADHDAIMAAELAAHRAGLAEWTAQKRAAAVA